MKHLNSLFLTATVLTILFTSCSKSNNTPATTNLQITVKDKSNNTIPNAVVAIYASNADLVYNKNQIRTGMSDANGNITFTNLSTIKYYYVAGTGCQNNVTTGDSTSLPLLFGQTTNVVATIAPAGDLQFTNNSTNPYSVYINGTFAFTLNGRLTFSTGFVIMTGPYTIRVVQNSGFLVTATDETFTGTLTCGGTLTTTFP